MEKKTTKQTKEKMVKETVAKENFDRVKKLSMCASHYAIASMEEILLHFLSFIEKVYKTNPGEQTLLKAVAEEEERYVLDSLAALRKSKKITEKYINGDKNNEN